MLDIKRNLIIDTTKAYGIVLVVIGHAPGIPELLISLIYSFHMPLFFFISGYLLSSNRLRLESWNGWLWRSGKTLFLPCLLYTSDAADE